MKSCLRKAIHVARSIVVPLTLTGFLVAGCGILPAEGPTALMVVNNTDDPLSGLPFDVIPLDTQVADIVRKASQTSLRSVGGLGLARAVDLIGVGDIVGVSIFEAGPGGLFSGVLRTNTFTGATSETLPRLPVDRGGNITVPYAGQVRAAGRTPLEVQRTIEDRLKDRAIQPQVVVTIVSNVSNSATITGDVKNPGRVPLSLAGEKLVDVIALSGGATRPAQDITVRVTRGQRAGSALLKTVYNSPDENIRVFPRDQIELLYRPRTYTAFGATGKTAEIPFDADIVTLAEALARAGGLNDLRADPTAVFLFRFEQRSIANRLGLKGAPTALGVPVVYRLNLIDASSYFIARTFEMRDKDIVYVPNAPSVEIVKFLNFIRAGTQIAYDVRAATTLGR